MASSDMNVDIFGNVFRIEKQKARLLEYVSRLYSMLAAGNDTTNTEISDQMASIIASVYMLGRSLGVSDEELEKSLDNFERIEKFEI